MKVTFSRETLLKPLLMTSHIIARQQTLPILSHILFVIHEGLLSITATDLEIELKTEISIDTDQNIAYTLPARKLTDICKTLPNDAEISLEFKENKMILRSGHGRYMMSTLRADDYPAIEMNASTQRVQLNESALKKIIDKTSFSMAQQDVRYYLNGLLFEIQQQKIRVVATDGHRLSIAETVAEHTIKEDVQIILPRKAVIELGRLLHKDGKEQAEITFNTNHFQVTVGNVFFTTKLIDGKFPDYENILPSEQQAKQLKADREALKQVLTRTSVLSNEKFCSTSFQIQPNNLCLQVNNSDNDEAEEQLSIDYTGESIQIGFNVDYFLDVLQVIETEKIQMIFTSADSSTLIKPVGEEDHRYIVMPMRL